ALAALDYDGLRDIRFKEDQTLWRSDALPYELKFFHVGRQSDSVRVNEVSPQGVKRLPYRSEQFTFGKNPLNSKAWGELG
ncbi:glucan biosynthesis protein, partial [Roseateles sp. GG27B]